MLKKILVVLVVVLLAKWLLFPGGESAEADFENSVVRIITFKYDQKGKIGTFLGTGFVLNKDGYIATNDHVVRNAIQSNGVTRMYVLREGDSITGQDAFDNPNVALVEWKSKELDLALIKLKDDHNLHLKPIVLAGTLPDKGQMVKAIGYPAVADITMTGRNITANSTVTDGVLSRPIENGSWGGTELRQVQHTAAINGGNSGGPLVDRCGRVIGVNTATPTAASEGVSYASDIRELIDVLERKDITYSMADSKCLSEGDVFTKQLQMVLLGGGAAFLVISSLIVVTMRRPREQVVRYVNSASQAVRRSLHRPGPRQGQIKAAAPQGRTRPVGATMPVPPSTTPNIVLTGYTSDGEDYRIVIRGADLASPTGVTIGRESPNPEYIIAHDTVSRNHATLTWQGGGNFQVEDLGSTNGTSLNENKLEPGQSYPIRNGDKLKLGSVKLEVLFT